MIMAGQLAATLVAFRAFNVLEHQRGAPTKDPKLPSKPGDCATEERSTATVDISDAV
ncbi:hypothetical protein Pmar_PMAR005292 [Perkinsus marinus ATCC 50983]|uniref:Uncharacterized protein n=1 Tax=Perkinsus marinus (strain ATCC 50983 / TXsc) TaxID=423536 RepID=C5KB55_PERM5|nr:hypothetical protein Pmar_PMAR005292 [Perkinsus marinus ATCC 50983]EER18381.1 hypothetical protein Pmar_PMAR005292 [Perkinsus marinus ATCC 50983]|eukprot:XP_002786585.1 hypothetical protein Pmar_PMAR005292 [Perkinsus marinus ATCC 50983]